MNLSIIILVAVIEAANEALKSAPELTRAMPSFMSSGFWNFVPIILLSVLGILWLVRFARANFTRAEHPASDAEIILQSPDDLFALSARIRSAIEAIQAKTSAFEDSMNGSRDIWQEWLSSKNDAFGKYINDSLGTGIETTEIETLRTTLVEHAKDLRAQCEHLNKILNFHFKPLA